MPPQNQSQRIIIKVAITKANTGSDSTPVEKTVYARRDSFTKIKSKAALTAYLSKELPDYISSDASYLAFTRKSKSTKTLSRWTQRMTSSHLQEA